MDSNQILSGGGRGSDLASDASAQPGSAATAQFPYSEPDLVAKLGVPADKIAAARKSLHQGSDWSRISRQFMWSDVGIKNLAAGLGCPAIESDVKTAATALITENPAPTAAPGAVETVTVFNLTIPNQRLVLCRDARGQTVKVFINHEWRPLFRLGMKIEAVLGTSGQWRTRKPRGVGRF